jgi:uncharacterized protein YggE
MKVRRNLLWAIVIQFAVFFGCIQPNAYGQSNFNVTGIGTVFAQPDMVQMTVSTSHVARTTRQAQTEVNKVVKQILDILKEAEIEEKDIRTASLRFNSEYEFRSNRKVLVGHKVEQSLTFVVHNIKENVEKAPEILDKLTQINNVTLNRITFGITDDTEYLIKSREIAYQKALAKAEHYAELSGLKIVKVLSISELTTENQRELYQLAGAGFARREENDSNSTMLPIGEKEISTRITVIFLAE